MKSYIFAAPSEKFCSFRHHVLELCGDTGACRYRISHSSRSYTKDSSYFSRSVGSYFGWIGEKSRKCVSILLWRGVDRDIRWLSACPSPNGLQTIVDVTVSLVFYLENSKSILSLVVYKLLGRIPTCHWVKPELYLSDKSSP